MKRSLLKYLLGLFLALTAYAQFPPIGWQIPPAAGGGGGGGTATQYVGTFTGTGPTTITAATHGQGTHPLVVLYDSLGDETAAPVSCKTAGAAKVGCADSTSNGDVVIGTVISDTYTYVIYSGGGVGATGATGSAGPNTVTIGSTTIGSGTTTRVLYDNAGVFGELATTGSSSVVRANSPSLVTPNLDIPSAIDLTNATKVPITLTTTGSSGAASYTQSTSTLNIPQYTGGSGASNTNQLTDLAVVRTSTKIVTGTIPAGGSNIGFGAAITPLGGASATTYIITISGSGAAAATTFYVYKLTTSSAILVDTTGANFTGIACSGTYGCTTTNTGVSGYPVDSYPLFRLTAGATTTTWDAFSSCLPSNASGCIDDRRVLGRDVTSPGANMTQSVALGVKTLGVDPTTTLNWTGSFSVGPGLFSALPACAGGTEGTLRGVTDSSTVTWGATITGGSSSHVLAYCDGTNWTVAGK